MSTTLERAHVADDPRLQTGAYLAHDHTLYRNCGRLDHSDDPLAGAWLIEDARSTWDQEQRQWTHQTQVVSTYDLLNEHDPYQEINRNPQWRK